MNPNQTKALRAAPAAHRPTLFVIALALLGALSGTPALAQTSKTTPVPITIEADQMQYDDKARVNVFDGNVVMVRGDLEIRARRLRLNETSSGNQQAVASGSPARFVQRRPGDQMKVEGEGAELHYDNQREQLTIIGGATLLRSMPGQAPDRVSGARIVYQSRNDFFTVEGGKDATTEANPRGRVQVVIKPRSKEADAAAEPGAALAPARTIANQGGKAR